MGKVSVSSSWVTDELFVLDTVNISIMLYVRVVLTKKQGYQIRSSVDRIYAYDTTYDKYDEYEVRYDIVNEKKGKKYENGEKAI